MPATDTMQVAEDEDRETEDDLDEEDEEYDSGGSGVAMTPPGAFSYFCCQCLEISCKPCNFFV